MEDRKGTISAINLIFNNLIINNMKELLKNEGVVIYEDSILDVQVHIKKGSSFVNAASMRAKDPAKISEIHEIQEKDLSFFSTFDATEEEETQIFMFLFDLWITKYRNFLSDSI